MACMLSPSTQPSGNPADRARHKSLNTAALILGDLIGGARRDHRRATAAFSSGRPAATNQVTPPPKQKTLTCDPRRISMLTGFGDNANPHEVCHKLLRANRTQSAGCIAFTYRSAATLPREQIDRQRYVTGFATRRVTSF